MIPNPRSPILDPGFLGNPKLTHRTTVTFVIYYSVFHDSNHGHPSQENSVQISEFKPWIFTVHFPEITKLSKLHSALQKKYVWPFPLLSNGSANWHTVP